MEVHDVAEHALVGAVGDDDDLQVAVPVAVDDRVEDVGEERAALLDRVEARGPEEDRRIVVAVEPEVLLQPALGGELAGGLRGGRVLLRKRLVRGGVVVAVGRVEDALGAAGGGLGADLGADGVRDEVVLAADDLVEERGRDGVHVVRGEDAGGEQVHRDVAVARELVVAGHRRVVQLAPELRRVDAEVLDLGERELARVDVVDREERADPHRAGGGRDEARHPVVAVHEVGADDRDDVVDHLALERQRDAGVHLVVAGVDAVAVVEEAVLREVDAGLGEDGLVDEQLALDEVPHVHVEHLAVVGEGDVHVRPELEERGDERGGDVREAAGLGGHAVGHVAHPGREVGDLRRDDEDGGVLLPGGSGHGRGSVAGLGFRKGRGLYHNRGSMSRPNENSA